MSKFVINQSNAFKKELKKLIKRNYDITRLSVAVDILAEGKTLPPEYRDHPLKGDFMGYRDCHIQPDWILIYRHDNDNLILLLLHTGTHSDLFGE